MIAIFAAFIAGAALACAFCLKIVDAAREQGRQQGHDEAMAVRRNVLRLEGRGWAAWVNPGEPKMEGTRFPRNGGSAA